MEFDKIQNKDLVMDVSELREKLLESEEKFIKLAENSKIIIFYIQGTHIVYSNPEFESTLGYSPKDLEKIQFWDIVIPEFRDVIKNRGLARLHGESVPSQYEVKILDRNGDEKWLYLGASLVSINDIPTTIASAIDITDRKESEKKLLDAEERLKFLMDATHDAIYDWDLVNSTLYFSPSYYKMLKYEDQEFPPSIEQFYALIHPEDKSQIEAYIQKYLRLKNPSSYEWEFRLRCKDGEYIPILSRGKAVASDEYGNPTRIVGTHVNLTKKKQNDNEMIKLQKLESLGVLAGGIAHDFNNILTIILGNLNMIRVKSNPTAATMKYIRNAEIAARKATVLTKKFITFSKGGNPMKQMINVPEYLESELNLHTSGLHIELRTELPQNIYQIELDPDQIGQVIMNFILNAQDAMPEGGTLTIKGENVHFQDSTYNLEPGYYVKLSFIDTGSGLPEDVLPKVFEPYFSTKESSGLGLAVSLSIVQQHHGTIIALNNVQGGAQFDLYLPALVSAPTEAEVNLANLDLESPHYNILIMDDELLITEMLKMFFSELGHNVWGVGKGEDAIEKFLQVQNTNQEIDVAILDLTVPIGMGGKETNLKLKELKPSLISIVTSGYEDDPAMREFEKFGFNGKLRKPFDFSDLSKISDSFLKK